MSKEDESWEGVKLSNSETKLLIIINEAQSSGRSLEALAQMVPFYLLYRKETSPDPSFCGLHKRKFGAGSRRGSD